VLDANHRGSGYGRVAARGIFQIQRTDPFTAGLDQILGAVADLQNTL